MIYYSIIIPHKNMSGLLQYCLDSIPLREDVQVIVVDDNSDAEIVDFEHFPQWKGTHYEYYLTKEGKGAGYARNVGLEHAEGRWVLIAGADDFFLPAFGAIMDEERETDVDLIFFRPKAVLLEDRISQSKRADVYNRFIDDYLHSSDDGRIRCRWLSDVSKFYRLQMIRDHQIRFDEIRYSNDNLFSVKAGVSARKIAVREKAFYCITESEGTLTSHFLKKPGEFQIRGDAFFRAQEIVHDAGYPIDEETALFFLRELFSRDRNAFGMGFKRMRKMGYEKCWLLREVFKNHSRKAFYKRFLYGLVALP